MLRRPEENKIHERIPMTKEKRNEYRLNRELYEANKGIVLS